MNGVYHITKMPSIIQCIYQNTPFDSHALWPGVFETGPPKLASVIGLKMVALIPKTRLDQVGPGWADILLVSHMQVG